MLALQWDAINERYYEHGLDRGVLYPAGGAPEVWNGLTGFDEGGSAESSMLYRDGIVFLADAEASDFEGKLTTIFFPDSFRECLGMPEAAPGLYVDNQKPKRFSFSYRTLVGSGLSGDRFGYQIHLVYNAVATLDPRSRKTNGPDVAMVDFSFNIVCTPVRLPGYRPSAHYIIDTRGLPAGKLEELETILYGSTEGLDAIGEPIAEPISSPLVGRMPTPTELYDIITDV